MATTVSAADQQRTQQKELWTGAAPAWEKADAWMEEMLGALAVWLVDALGIAAGARVLDVACGTGHPATELSARVGPGGRVDAVDLTPAMVAATERTVLRLGLSNVEVREMDAERLDFPDRTFAAATCRFGLMFCPDPGRAASELHRVVVPGGRVAVAVWDEAARNPFFTAIGKLAGEFVPLPPPDPSAPGVFRLAPPGELAATLERAGFTDIRIEPRPITFRYTSPEHYWEIQSLLAGPLRTAIATLPPDELVRLETAVKALATANTVDGEVRFIGTPLCAVATRAS